MIPPKRAFTDNDYYSNPAPSPFPSKRRKNFASSDWRRPEARHEWWAVSEGEWERIPPAKKMNWTHVGRIMETEEGEPSPKACEQCVVAGDPRGCWVYSREAMRRYGFKTHVCARCRASANVCSLNPYFRNSLGLRDSRPPPDRQLSHDLPFPPTGPPPPPPQGEGRHRFASMEPERRYRSATPPSERHGRGWPRSLAKRRSCTSLDDREKDPPVKVHRFPSPYSHERHRIQSPPPPQRPPPNCPPSHKNVSSLESIAARMEVLEQQMEAMHKESLLIKEENGFLRWRLAELEALLPTGPAEGEQDAEKKPPSALTEQSASAVETLVMEESIVSSLREQEQGGKKIESERGAEQQRGKREQEEREMERAETEREKEEEQESQQQVAAELDALRQESVAMTRRVIEREKGQAMTTQIFRDMYYALDD